MMHASLTPSFPCVLPHVAEVWAGNMTWQARPPRLLVSGAKLLALANWQTGCHGCLTWTELSATARSIPAEMHRQKHDTFAIALVSSNPIMDQMSCHTVGLHFGYTRAFVLRL